MMTELDTTTSPEEKRPTLLTVIAILSLIWIGFGLIGGLVSLGSGPISEEALRTISIENARQKQEMRDLGFDWGVRTIEQSEKMMMEINEHHYFAKGLEILIYGIGLVGVVFMLRRRKLGFHMYIIYSLLAVGGPYLYVSVVNIPSFITITTVVISALFIFLYSRNLSWMK